ncbi:MAG TPA: pilus assembly protein TadG-related protein [Acidimicrobiales bacterium]|nr:pilus assembly protein TadG-related protein [Acidimicrobiales bacterium]
MIHRLMRKKDERGAVLVLSTVGLVMALIFGGLAIELGFVAQEARRNQKVADLAALDAVRMLPNDPSAEAVASAARNGFDAAANVLTEWGPAKTGPWSSSPGDLATAKAVRITIDSTHDNLMPFLDDGQNVVRRAIAEKRDIAGFTMGSSLVSLNSSSSPILNAVTSRWLGGTVNLSLLSWQGLAAGNVSLEAIRTELVDMGFNVGSVDEMLNADLNLAQFYRATAQAVARGGDTANANVLDVLRLQAVSATTFKLNEMIVVGQGGSASAADAQLNLLQLVTGSAATVNGSNTVTVPNIGVNIPGVAQTSVSLKVIEGPKTYIGPAGTGPHVKTGQIELTLTPTINTVNLLGLLKVTGTAPIDLMAAGATGALKSIECPQKNITVTADPIAINSSTKTTQLAVTTLGNVPVLKVNATAARSAIDGPAQDLTFAYDAQFNPPNDFSKHAGSQPVGLQSLTNVTGTTTDVSLLGLLSVGLGESTVLNAVVGLLDDIIGDVDEFILTPLLSSLGLDVGGADVTALGYDAATGIGLPQCGLPTLAG